MFLNNIGYVDVGVVQAMTEVWGADFYKRTMLCGGSAGTIFAIGIALGKTPAELNDLYRDVAEKANKSGTVYYASVFMEEALRILLQDEMAFKLLEGRCCFGTTEFFSKHRWHVSWKDNEDLVYTACGSCHIPFYCQRNVGIKDTLIVDGAYGFAGKDLPHGDDTLYIGIDPNAEVTRLFTNDQMMYPVIGREYEEVVKSGYDAFMVWNGTYTPKVGVRVPNYQALYVLWTLKIFEYFWHHIEYVLLYLYIMMLWLVGQDVAFSREKNGSAKILRNASRQHLTDQKVDEKSD